MVTWLSLILPALVLAALSTAWATPPAPDDVQGPIAWSGTENVRRLGNLWLAGQPDEKGFEEAKAAGVGVVVNLRAPEELDFDEKKVVETLGLEYHNVPIRSGEPLSKEAVARIGEIVEKNEDRGVLIHCASGNRVGAWLSAYLADSKDLPAQEALAIGERAGMTKPGARAMAEEYLRRNVSSHTPGP